MNCQEYKMLAGPIIGQGEFEDRTGKHGVFLIMRKKNKIYKTANIQFLCLQCSSSIPYRALYGVRWITLSTEKMKTVAWGDIYLCTIRKSCSLRRQKEVACIPRRSVRYCVLCFPCAYSVKTKQRRILLVQLQPMFPFNTVRLLSLIHIQMCIRDRYIACK